MAGSGPSRGGHPLHIAGEVPRKWKRREDRGRSGKMRPRRKSRAGRADDEGPGAERISAARRAQAIRRRLQTPARMPRRGAAAARGIAKAPPTPRQAGAPQGGNRIGSFFGEWDIGAAAGRAAGEDPCRGDPTARLARPLRPGVHRPDGLAGGPVARPARRRARTE